jgi:hypothetical protein
MPQRILIVDKKSIEVNLKSIQRRRSSMERSQEEGV